MTTNARAPGARSGDVRHRLFLFAILTIAIMLSCNPTFAAEQVGSNAIAPRKLAIGVFVNDPALGGGAWDAPVMDNFARMVGAKPSAWHWYAPFGAPFESQPFNAASSRGYMPVLSWGASDANNSPISWERVAAGAVDNLIRKFARSAAAWRKPFYLRPQWEMNLSFDSRGNTPRSFVRMWKRMHNIFVQEGAVNVRWIWNPAEEGEAPRTPYASYYPGDAYVNYIGFDAYNWGRSKSWAYWRSPAQTYGPTYRAIAKVSSKPMIIGETGCVEQGGDKAAWMMQLKDVPRQFPRIVGLLYFHNNQDGANWRVNTSSRSLAAFRALMASPVSRGRLP